MVICWTGCLVVRTFHHLGTTGHRCVRDILHWSSFIASIVKNRTNSNMVFSGTSALISLVFMWRWTNAFSAFFFSDKCNTGEWTQVNERAYITFEIMTVAGCNEESFNVTSPRADCEINEMRFTTGTGRCQIIDLCNDKSLSDKCKCGEMPSQFSLCAITFIVGPEDSGLYNICHIVGGHCNNWHNFFLNVLSESTASSLSNTSLGNTTFATDKQNTTASPITFLPDKQAVENCETTGSKNYNHGIIAGFVSAGIVFLVFVGVIIYCTRRRQNPVFRCNPELEYVQVTEHNEISAKQMLGNPTRGSRVILN